MWVRLLKSDGKLKVGKVVKKLNYIARQMIQDKQAFEYTDGFPVKKMKTDFFKPDKD